MGLALAGGPLARIHPWLGAASFAAAAGMLVLAFWGERVETLPLNSPPRQRWEPWFYLGLLALACASRLWRLEDFPVSAHGHEGEMVTRLLSLENQPFQVHLRDPNINWPSLIFYQALAAARYLGWTVSSFRLPGALWGILTVAVFYPLARRLSSPVAAAGASLLFACSGSSLVMARNFFPGSLVQFGLLASLWCILQGRERAQWRYFAMAGCCGALCLWGYTAGRIAPLILLLWVGEGVLSRFAIRWSSSLVFLLCLTLGVLPILLFALKDPHDYWDYMLVHANPSHNQGVSAYVDTFFETLPHYVRMFHIRGDVDPGNQIPLEPVLDLVSGALFPIGFLLCLLLIPGNLPVLLILWLILGLLPALLGTGFSHPVVRRTILATPAIYIFVAIAFERLRLAFQRGFIRDGTFILLALCAGGAVYNVRHYFVDFSRSPEVMAYRDMSNKYLKKEADRFPQARLLVAPLFRGNIQQKTQPFFFPKRRLEELRDLEDIFAQPDGELLVLADPLYAPAGPWLESIFPGSKSWTFAAPAWDLGSDASDSQVMEALRTSKDPFRPDLMYLALHLPAGSLSKALGSAEPKAFVAGLKTGLHADYFRGESPGTKPDFSRRYLLPAWRIQGYFPLPDPFCARVRGILTPPKAGSYRFRTPLWCHARIKVDGKVVFEDRAGQPQMDGSVDLGNRPVPIEVETAAFKTELPERVFELRWMLPGESAFRMVDRQCVKPE